MKGQRYMISMSDTLENKLCVSMYYLTGFVKYIFVLEQYERKPESFETETLLHEGLPTVLCHLFTANSRLQVTVTTAGMVRWGSVLAATCVTGEFDGNLRTIITSCCIWSLNISGLCGRKHCWVERRREQKKTEGIKQLVRRSEGKIRLRKSGNICTYKGNNAICAPMLQNTGH